MPITVHEGSTLKKAAFQLEEHVFRNCVLIECTLYYSGGDFEFVNAQFQNCNFSFRGAARNTMQLQMTIGMLKPTQQPTPQNITATAKMN